MHEPVTRPAGRQSGLTLIWVIAAITAIAAVAAGAVALTRTAGIHEPMLNLDNRARSLADTGINFAATYAQDVRSNTGKTLTDINGLNFNSYLGTGEQLALNAASLGSNNFLVTSTGTVNANASPRASYTASRVINAVPGSLVNPTDPTDPTNPTNPPANTTPQGPRDYVLASYSGTVKTATGQGVTVTNATSIGSNSALEIGYGDVFNNNIYLVANGDVQIDQATQFKGTNNVICAKGSVDLGYQDSSANNVTYTGTITASNSVTIRQGNYVIGTIKAISGVVNCNYASRVDGTIYSYGDVTLAQNVIINGNIITNGQVKIGYGVTVNGEIRAKGNVSMDQNAVVTGKIYTLGKTSLGYAATVNGDVYSCGPINLGNKATITGIQSRTCSTTIDQTPFQQNSCNFSLITPKLTAIPSEPMGGGDYVNLKPNLDYGNVTYDTWTSVGNKAIFKSGHTSPDGKANNYYFDSLTTDYKCSFCMDFTPGGEINIFSTGNVSLGQNLSIYIASASGGCSLNSSGNYSNAKLMTDPSVSQDLAGYSYLETHGSFSLGYQGQWFGTVLGKTSVFFDNETQLIGSYASIDNPFKTNYEFSVIYIPSRYALDYWQ